MPREEFVASAPNTISFEKHPVLREKFIELFSLSSGAEQRRASGWPSCCAACRKAEVPAGLGYENVFRVVIVQFMDRFNFCVGGVKRSCIHFVDAERPDHPVRHLQLFYRNGRSTASGRAGLRRRKRSYSLAAAGGS